MVKHFCDSCKKEVKFSDLVNIKIEGLGFPDFFVKYELCENCANEIISKCRDESEEIEEELECIQ